MFRDIPTSASLNPKTLNHNPGSFARCEQSFNPGGGELCLPGGPLRLLDACQVILGVMLGLHIGMMEKQMETRIL